MKAELKITVIRLVILVALFSAVAALSGCKSPKKMRDIELKGMYVNGYSEVLAIGSGRLTSIPGDREALAAHYEEDTAWLQPNVKTHKIDIFLVGSNSTQHASHILGDICKAFAEVAPGIAKENAEVAKSVATVTPPGVVKAGGETRKDTFADSQGDCADGSCSSGICTDGSCTTCTDCEAN